LADSIRSAAFIAVELSNNDRTIRSFREAFPLVSLTLEEFLSNELIECLRNEQMDAAIVHTCLVDPEGLDAFARGTDGGGPAPAKNSFSMAQQALGVT